MPQSFSRATASSSRAVQHGKGSWRQRVSGAEGSPIVINRYGEGKRPRIDGEGRVEDTVRLYNVQQIELRNLEITNQAKTPAIRRGVHVFLDNFGDARHIVLAGLYIHHISGDNRRKDNGGIVIRTQRRPEAQPVRRPPDRAQHHLEG